MWIVTVKSINVPDNESEDFLDYFKTYSRDVYYNNVLRCYFPKDDSYGISDLSHRYELSSRRLLRILRPVIVVNRSVASIIHLRDLIEHFGVKMAVYVSLDTTGYYYGGYSCTKLSDPMKGRLNIFIHNRTGFLKSQINGRKYSMMLIDKKSEMSLISINVLDGYVKDIIKSHFSFNFTLPPREEDSARLSSFRKVRLCFNAKIKNLDGKPRLTGVRPIIKFGAPSRITRSMTDLMQCIIKCIPMVCNSMSEYRILMSDIISESRGIMCGDVKSLYTCIKIDDAIQGLSEILEYVIPSSDDPDMRSYVDCRHQILDMIRSELKKRYRLSKKILFDEMSVLPMGHNLSAQLAVIYIANKLRRANILEGGSKFNILVYVDDILVTSRYRVDSPKALRSWECGVRRKIREALDGLNVKWDRGLITNRPGDGKRRWEMMSVGYGISSNTEIVYSPRKIQHITTMRDGKLVKRSHATSSINLIMKYHVKVALETYCSDVSPNSEESVDIILKRMLTHMHNNEKRSLYCYRLYHNCSYVDEDCVEDAIRECRSCFYTDYLMKNFRHTFIKLIRKQHESDPARERNECVDKIQRYVVSIVGNDCASGDLSSVSRSGSDESGASSRDPSRVMSITNPFNISSKYLMKLKRDITKDGSGSLHGTDTSDSEVSSLTS